MGDEECVHVLKQRGNQGEGASQAQRQLPRLPAHSSLASLGFQLVANGSPISQSQEALTTLFPAARQPADLPSSGDLLDQLRGTSPEPW